MHLSKKEILKIKTGERIRKDIGELDSLKNSIKEIGLLHPIVIDENDNLIAGLRRLEAYKELGYREIPVNLVNVKDLVRGQCDENVIRKNFTPSEAVAIWETLERPKGGRGKTRSDSEQVIKRATKLTGLSTDTLSKAKQVVEFGNKELIQQMDKDGGNVNKVYKTMKKKKRKKELEEQGKNYKEKDDIKIIHNDFRKVELEDNSVDLILTDPPYPEEHLSLWQDLFIMAERVLKPSGFLVAYSGQMYLDKIFQMKNNLIYYWTSALLFTKKPLIAGRNIQNSWKPILVFQKEPFSKTKDSIVDLIKSKYAEAERELHDKNWGQTVQPFEKLLDTFSKVGDLVLDPFAGSGTVLIACKRKKRKAIGIEIEKKYINLIKGRLESEV